ncbi:MAG: hypothetical protein H6819_09920 [Phycisphaerales bacterium]|nr:hypothetical protein [Phycisphaerales bacterium]MCB9857965.1 hypothetical protein [Phycisphaerales bacterium]MCB9864942.1 hypothetical protein [Phycisphaerales bacterium]
MLAGDEIVSIRSLSLLCLLTYVTWPIAASGAEINVLEWTLETIVNIGSDYAGQLNFDPMNNWHAMQQGMLGNSSAQSVYDVSWTSDGLFEFMLVSEHVCQGGDNVKCRSSGNIFLRPSVESTLDIASEYNYAMGSGTRTSRVEFGLCEYDPIVAIFRNSIIRNSIVNPAIGQITYHSDPTTLAANRTYVITYDLESRSFTGNSSSLSHADGFLHVAIAPIPEPTATLMLLVAAPLHLRRRRR